MPSHLFSKKKPPGTASTLLTLVHLLTILSCDGAKHRVWIQGREKAENVQKIPAWVWDAFRLSWLSCLALVLC